MKLQDLKPNEKNPRTISPERLTMLKKSLDEFGDLSGIVNNTRFNRLVGGHQRHKLMPRDSEIVIEAKFPVPSKTGTTAEGYALVNGERFKYREVSWDEAKEKAANIAANKHGGEWDEPRLGEWLADLDALGYDMDLTGFDAAELARLAAQQQAADNEDIEDDVPGTPTEPISKLGDLYEFGGHRVLCGDSTNPEHVAKLMGGQLADMVWTDPPYNVDYEGKTKDALKIENDKMDSGQFQSFLLAAYKNLFDSTKPGGAIYVAHADSEGANFRSTMVAGGWLLKQCLVWVKQTFAMSRQDYHWKHEPILYGWKPGAAHNWFTDRKQTTVLEFNKPNRNAEHPTMKPIELIEYCVKNSCPDLGSVLDLFGGSGSTLITCQKTQRKSFAMELSPAYCDVIVSRWVKYTQKNEITRNGQPMTWTPKS